MDRPGGGRAENGPRAGLGLLLAPAPRLRRDAPDPAATGMREGTQLLGHRLGRQDMGSGSAVCLLNYCWTFLVHMPPRPYTHMNTHTPSPQSSCRRSPRQDHQVTKSWLCSLSPPYKLCDPGHCLNVSVPPSTQQGLIKRLLCARYWPTHGASSESRANSPALWWVHPGRDRE